MSPGSVALTADLRQVAEEVALWCQKTSDSPRDGARSLMVGSAMLAARAAARADFGTAKEQGRRVLAFELFIERLEGVRR